MRKYIALIVSLLLPLVSGAYNDHRGHKLDSLERAVAIWTPDAVEKASTKELVDLNNAYRELMLGYNQINAGKCIFYARKALAISTREGWSYANADVLRYIGQHFWAREQYDSALVYFKNAMENVERMEAGATSPTRPEGYTEEDVDDMRSALYGATGNLYNVMGDIPRAMDYYARAGEIFDKYGWNVSNAVLYYNIGETWVDESDFRAAKKAYLKSLDYATSEGDSLWMAVARKGLGRMYLEQGRTRKALQYLYEADDYFAVHDQEEAISRKENFEYMSRALDGQRRLLAWLLAGLVVLLLLAAGILLLMRKLRISRKEQTEANAVMEETLEDLNKASRKSEIPLSPREREILDLLAKGYTTPQIAECLHLSPETIKWYRKKLLVKFDVSNVAELVKNSIFTS